MKNKKEFRIAGLTFGQEAVQGKSNEIPATQRLIKMLNIKGCVVVADALNCQKETAKAIISQKQPLQSGTITSQAKK